MIQIATTESLRADTIVASLQEAKEKAVWGTFGKGGVEHCNEHCNGACNKHPLRVVRLIDCSTEHLQAILRTQYQIRGHAYEEIILSILADRGIQTPKFQ
jgi:hypothetical protein